QNSRRNRDDVPQSFFHETKLLPQNRLFRFRFFLGFGMVNKKSDDVKKSGKITDHKNEVNGFYDWVKFHVGKINQYLNISFKVDLINSTSFCEILPNRFFKRSFATERM